MRIAHCIAIRFVAMGICTHDRYRHGDLHADLEPATSRSTVVYVAELENRTAGFGACGAQRTEGLWRGQSVGPTGSAPVALAIRASVSAWRWPCVRTIRRPAW